ncbi:MAG: hypothetical protein IEMM0002_1584 [bacterium]|nr:MAG: hypothetical protein IEMM0002_1584 [bacterium]
MKDFLRTKRKPVCVYLRRLFWLIIFFTAGPAVTAQSEDEPLSISADYISRNNKTGETTANGNVIIKQKDIIIYGDKATLNETDRTSNVAGNVKLILPDVEIEASRINLNIDTNFGSMEDASGRTADGFVFTGRKIQKVTKDRYLIWDGTFTTCQEDEPDWIFKSGFTSLDIDNMVWLRDVSFYFFDLPLAYAPLWGAPAATKRTTGLLGPTFGVSSVNGTYINNTFFWAKSDSEDVSYYFDYMDLRGFRHGLEYRYAFAEKTRGQLNYNYIYDQRLEENLWNVKYHHRQKFKNGADSRARFDYES